MFDEPLHVVGVDESRPFRQSDLAAVAGDEVVVLAVRGRSAGPALLLDEVQVAMLIDDDASLALAMPAGRLQSAVAVALSPGGGRLRARTGHAVAGADAAGDLLDRLRPEARHRAEGFGRIDDSHRHEA